MNEIILKENKSLTIEPLIKRFLNYVDVSDSSVQTYSVGLAQFNNYLKESNIKNPTREDIIGFRESLKTTHKPNTVNAYLIAVRNFYSWLEYENITKDVSKKVKGIKLEKYHLKRGLSQEEIKKILDVCKDTREELLIKIMIICALRINEVRNIRLEDFYDDRGVVMLKVLGKAREGLKRDSVKIDDRLIDDSQPDGWIHMNSLQSVKVNQVSLIATQRAKMDLKLKRFKIFVPIKMPHQSGGMLQLF